MKKLFTTLLLVFSLSLCKAQWVTIPDAHFASFLQNTYPYYNCMNGNLMDTTCWIVTSVYNFNCSGEIIHDLDGIQYFDSLKTLDCSSNQISFLPPLPRMLTSLNCSYNQLSSLPNLPDSLKNLQCNYNQITSLPNQLPNLTNLGCSNNLITTWSPLPITLTGFDCTHNLLTSIPSLPPHLVAFNCCFNQLTSLPALPHSLQQIQCYNNQLTSLPNLDTTVLNSLWCMNNNISVIPHLPLTMMDLAAYNNNLTTITNLPDSLSGFYMNDNPNLLCMPPLKKFIGLYPQWFSIFNTGIECLPNAIQHTGYNAGIDTMPICDIFNINGCDFSWNINGTMYQDENSDCNLQSNENNLCNIKMRLYDAGGLVSEGYFANHYSFNTDFGFYNVKADTTDLPFYISCPSSGDTTLHVASYDSIFSDIDFGFTCKPGFDLGAWSIFNSSNFFPGNYTSVIINAGDVTHGMYHSSCNASGISGQVKVQIDGAVSYISPMIGALVPDSISGNILIWNISDFGVLGSIENPFGFVVQSDTIMSGNNIICFNVTVTPSIGDNNPSNNNLTMCFGLDNSYDPNDKEVSPVNTVTPGQWLYYTIRFQNTGTAPAQHIFIRDTLDTNLRESTFQLLSYSHTPLVQIEGKNVVFNFPNINLPDSLSNEPDSHGYVQYRVKAKNNFPPFTAIKNIASIYFDFNTPVVTNTTNNIYCTSTNTILNNQICNGDAFAFYDSSYTISGTYTKTFQNTFGCDSSIILHLTVLDPISNSISQSICVGEIFDFNGQQLSSTGNYSVILNSINGCDSVVNLDLTVLNPISNTISENICSGDIYNFNGVSLNSSGIYIDTVNAASGCDSIVTLNLTVETINTTIQQLNDTLITTSTGTIQWLDCNTQQIIASANQSVFVPTVTGNYAAIITEGNCSDTSACFQVFTGVNELQTSDNKFQVYPNPTDENITVTLSQPFENCEIEITNTLRQIVYKQTMNQQSVNCNLELFEAGLYFITLRSDKFTAVKKIVKE